MTDRLGEWARRFWPAELAGTVCAAAAGFAIVSVTRSLAAAAIAAAWAETLGFYGWMVAYEVRRQHGRVSRHDPDAPWTQVGLSALRSLGIEFGVAEVLDVLLVRPYLMWLGPHLLHWFLPGLLVGKVCADIVFYGFAAAGYELNKRHEHDSDALAAVGSVDPTERTVLALRRDGFPAKTPFLLLDLDEVRRSYARLRHALSGVELHYAVKCNSDPEVLVLLHALGCGFDVASYQELAELRAIGVDPATLLYSNPVKPFEDIRRAALAGVSCFAFDSEAELTKLAEAAPGANVYVRIATRSSKSRVPSEGKFGVDKDTAVELLAAAREFGLRPYGIAFHVGSQTLDPQAWAVAIEASGVIMRALQQRGIEVEMLNVGGGFPARYDGPEPRFTDYGEVIRATCARALPYPVRLVAEPGRSLVASAGTMVTTVIGAAERGSRRWAHLDVGAFNGFMEALETRCGLRFPMGDSRGGPLARYDVTGPTCDSQDTVRRGVPLSADLAVGDRVYIHCAGAYTLAYASRFNGFDVPATRYLPTEPVSAIFPAGDELGASEPAALVSSGLGVGTVS